MSQFIKIMFLNVITSQRINQRRSWSSTHRQSMVAIITISIASMLFGNAAQAQSFSGLEPPVYVGPVPNVVPKSGYVLARAVVLDEEGKPTLVEYDEKGKEIAVVPIGNGNVLDMAVMAASDYRFFQQQLEDYLTANEDGLAVGSRLFSRREYQQAHFLAADSKTVIQAPALEEGVHSVLVRGERNRILGLSNQLILLQFPYDLKQNINLRENSLSLVVNNNGQVVYQSSNNISYRSGFYGDAENPNTTGIGRIEQGDQIFAPVTGTKVFVDDSGIYPGADASGEGGKFSFQVYLPLCPPGGMEFTTDVWAEIKYRSFQPLGAPVSSYYLRHPNFSACYAALVPAIRAAQVEADLATLAQTREQIKLFLDVMFLSGRISVENQAGENVPLGETTYTTFDQKADNITQSFYDFNGDGKYDHVVQGSLYDCTNNNDSTLTLELFVADTEQSELGDKLPGYSCEIIPWEAQLEIEDFGIDQYAQGEGYVQGIYFDGEKDDILDPPDLIRLIDQERRLQPTGMLKTISQNDMINTDILFFRESTGKLVMERRGLKQAEADYNPSVTYDEVNNQVAYRVMLRGPRDWNQNVGGQVDRTASYNEWATQNQLTESFRDRGGDYLRPGEYVKVVAINRATGYIGTKRVRIDSTNFDGTASPSIPVPDITLRPPNLKIWAERDFDIKQGLNKGEQLEQTIGAEGVALTSDKTITIYTEWLDSDGRPLPDEMALDEGKQYGYTGRLARVVPGSGLSGNRLQAENAGNDLAEFPIAPGRHTQVVKVGDNLTVPEHYYLHVIGKPKIQECVPGAICPAFDVLNNDFRLANRPMLLTPFLVPLPDENKHWQEYVSYRNLLRGLPADTPEQSRPIKPQPAYAWTFRPEYQFSQYNIAVSEITRGYESTTGDVNVADILQDSVPVIFSEDDYLKIFYDSFGSETTRLNAIDGIQELVLAVGEEEVAITMGADQNLRFENIDHLSKLDAEDYLSIRLYANNDTSNVLWQWAFAYVAFVDEFGNQVTLGQNYSHPKPVVTIGKNPQLDDFSVTDISVDNKIVNLTIHGRVTSDLADIVPNGAADIEKVSIIRPTGGTSSKSTREDVVVTKNTSEVVPQNQYLPWGEGEPRHTFIGEFSHSISFEVNQASATIVVEATNAIGQKGYDTITLEFNLTPNNVGLTENPDGTIPNAINSVHVITVDNNQSTSSGLFRPLWIEVIDPTLTLENFASAKVDFLIGSQGEAQRLDLVRHPQSGKYHANRAFVALASDFVNDITPQNVLNVYSIKESRTYLAYYAPELADDIPKTPNILSALATASNFLNWGYTAGDLPNYYAYVENTNIKLNWFSDLIEEEGFEITAVEAMEKPEEISADNPNLDWQPDTDIEIIKHGDLFHRPAFVMDNINQQNSDRKGLTFTIKIKKGALDRPHKCLNVRIKGRSPLRPNAIEYGRSNLSCFRIVTPKVIILAVDGLAYDSAFETITDNEIAQTLPEIFRAGSTVNQEKNTLAALPTITWANWPGVFSGQPPKGHGILGNSYFPRGTTKKFHTKDDVFDIQVNPIFSAGVKPAAIGIVARNQLRDQLGVAVFNNMKDMALPGAGSIYNDLHQVYALGDLNRRLGFQAIHTFYNKFDETIVREVDREMFVARIWGIGNSKEHNWEAARLLDDSNPTNCVFKTPIFGLNPACDGLEKVLGLENGTGPEAHAAWVSKKNQTDVFSLYLPGPDNVGHGIGNINADIYEAEPVPFELIDKFHRGFGVTNPVNSIATQVKHITDKAVSEIWAQIQADGYENAVIFSLVADHGQHQFVGVDHNNWEGNTELEPLIIEALDYNFLVQDLDEMVRANKEKNGLSRRIWRGDIVRDIVYSANGGLGQIYLRERNDQQWQAPTKQNVEDIAKWLHFFASNKGKVVEGNLFYNNKISPRHNIRTIDGNNESNYYDITVLNDKEGFTTDGAFGYPPAIFFRTEGFDSDYQWLDIEYEYDNQHGCMDVPRFNINQTDCFSIGQNYLYDGENKPKVKSTNYRSIEEFLAARKNRTERTLDQGGTGEPFNWPSFEQRLDEMNGIRSGDIIVITDGREGYLTIDNDGDSYRGWHGGPTVSESYVPLMISIPGKHFVDAAGADTGGMPSHVRESIQARINELKAEDSEGNLRNWHLSPLLVEAVRSLRNPSN